jgi:hypothetical protein
LLGKKILMIVGAPFQALYAGLGAIAGLLGKLGGAAAAGGSALVGGFRNLMGMLRTVIMAGLAPIIAVARVQLAGIWSMMLMNLRVITAAFGASMMAMWAALMAGIGAVVAAGSAVVMAGWRFMTDALYRAFGYFSVAMRMAWTGMILGIQAAIAAGSAGLTAAWAAASWGMVTITGAAGGALTTIWAGILAAQRTMIGVMTAMYAAGGRAALLLLAVPGRILVAFRALPAALLLLGPKLWAGMLMGGRILVAGMTSWIGLAVAAALGVAYAFRKQIADVWRGVTEDMGVVAEGAARAFNPLVNFFNTAVDYVTDAFWRMPAGVRDALLTVVEIVRSAAMQVYELFSYLNPWAHHSPSLVESVASGMEAVKKSYASVSNVGGVFGRAAADLAAFKRIASSLVGGGFSEERSNVAKGIPAQLALFDRMITDLKGMNTVLASQESAVKRQEGVVSGWKTKLDAANKALDAQQFKLDGLEKKLEKLNGAYDAHQSRLTDFASAPIKGMKAMQDQIFKNDMAQKKLRLGILNWEQANGTVDGLRDKMAKLQGSIETLSGQRSDLRMAGAGSDILGPISGQIDAMQKQYKAIAKTADASPVDKMKEELAKLETEGQALDLKFSIDFDPLLRQIDELANGMKELSFQEIVNGINKEKSAMAALTPQIDAANKAVEQQKAVVDAATGTRDRVSGQYDKEVEKLDILQKAYSDTTDTVRELENALRQLGSAGGIEIDIKDKAKRAKEAKKAKDPYLTPGAQNFKDAAGGNFPEVGGNAKIGREGKAGDQSAEIDALTKSYADDLGKKFAEFDMFAPIRDMWNKTWTWIQGKVDTYISPIVDKVKGYFRGGSGLFGSFKMPDFVINAWNSFVGFAQDAFDALKPIFAMFAPDIKKIIDAVVGAGKRVWKEIGPELAKFSELGAPLMDVLGMLWSGVKILAAIVGGVLVGAFKIVSSVLAGTLGPALDIVIDVMKVVVITVRETIRLILGIFNRDGSEIGEAAKNIFLGLVKGIGNILKDGFWLVVGLVKGLVNGVVDWFKWLYDVIIGHSIIPDLIDGIVAWFKGLWGKVKGAIKSFVDGVIDFMKDLPGDVAKALGSLKDKVSSAAQTAWDWFSDRVVRGNKKVIDFVSDLPGDAWNALKGLKDKLVDVATTAFTWFYNSQVAGWTVILTWLTSLPQKAWNALGNLRERLGNIATAAWDALESAWSIGWTALNTWLGGRPQKVWDALVALKERVGNIATQAWDMLEAAWAKGWAGTVLWLQGIGQRVWDNLSGKAGILEKIKNVATTAWDALESAWGTGWAATVLWLQGIGQRVWDNLSGKTGILAKIKDVAVSAWNALEDAWAAGWVTTVAWLQALGQRIWDNLSGKSGVSAKIKDIAKSAWGELEDAFGNGWSGFKDWLALLPGRIVAQITGKNGMGAKIADAAEDAFNALKTKASNIVDGKGGFMSWVRELPDRVASALSNIGSSVANATKGAWNGAANWINTNGIKNINRITSKLNFEMGDLPTFKRGGIVPGGHSKHDNMVIGARSGEGVLVPEAVRAIGGARGLENLNRNAERGRVASGYKEPVARNAGIGDGNGLVDRFKGAFEGVGNLAGDVTNWMRDGLGSAMNKLMVPLVDMADRNLGGNIVGRVGAGFLRQVKDNLVSFVQNGETQAGDRELGGMGFTRQMAILRAEFPGISMNSGFRPGSITSSGNQSYHALGRAVDIPPRMEYFDWILRNFGKTSKELIFSPAGGRQIHNGSPHVYSGAVKADHYDHVHWAYDQGGWLQPGVTQTVNRTGQPEAVFNPAQWGILKDVITGVGRMGQNGVAGTQRMASATITVERAWVNVTTAEVTTPAAPNNVTLHFHGDISLPNIKNGDDANEFLRNLTALAVT